ncbi:MAG: mandelate racemase/muconate lactonizing enzyme family protein [Alphaproteobacteria bacterium]|nr:mandelate racemase/muconate lactonizing enzyme family protein [Alphaproteobacteria bacterium]
MSIGQNEGGPPGRHPVSGAQTMIIDSIEAVPLRIPLSRDFGGSVYTVTSRCTVVTRLQVRDGPLAEIYNGDNRSHGVGIASLINDRLAPLVTGGDVRDWQRHAARLEAEIPGAAMSPELMMQAIACVDCAIWDAAARCYETSVSRLLGGYRREMPIISIGGYYQDGKTASDLAREMRLLRDRGMAGCKVKVGGMSPQEDAERVRAARDGAGPDFMLAVDANRGWSWRDAARFAGLVEHLDIAWFEEPCHWFDDIDGMRELRGRTSIPINAGQSEITGQAMRRLINSGAVDMVNNDASESGGVSGWLRVAGLARLAGLTMTHHEEPQIALHLLAAHPHGYCVECFADPERDPLWNGMLSTGPEIGDGVIRLVGEAGFGVTIDPDAVTRYRI